MSPAARERDANALAHRIVGEATGDQEPEPAKDPAAIERGRKGGLARAHRTSPEERSKDARKAVQARWEKRKISEGR